jgi:hypothetical protein
MRRHSSHRAECFLSALPEPRAFGIVLRDFHVSRATCDAETAHRVAVCIDAFRDSIELDEKNRRSISRISGCVD